MRAAGRRGSSALETALFFPLLALLLFGMLELARISYTYYQIQKTLYGLARQIGTQQGVNFCDPADPSLVAAKTWAVFGGGDETGETLINGLTIDMIDIRAERIGSGDELGTCECSAEGCDSTLGGRGPDFVVVSIPEGYVIQTRIPFMPVQAIPLRPHVRVPFGGT